MRRTLEIVPATVVLLTWVSLPAAGQVADSSMTRSVREGVYTEEQAQRGARVLEESCGSCHMEEWFKGTFLQSWNSTPASALYELIRTTMPEDRPRSLKRQQYADLLAYIFALNGLPPGEQELVGQMSVLRTIVIERRE